MLDLHFHTPNLQKAKPDSQEQHHDLPNKIDPVIHASVFNSTTQDMVTNDLDLYIQLEEKRKSRLIVATLLSLRGFR